MGQHLIYACVCVLVGGWIGSVTALWLESFCRFLWHSAGALADWVGRFGAAAGSGFWVCGSAV